MPRHRPLSESELAAVRALFDEGASLEVERARLYVSRMMLDLLAVREELRRERERALIEIERLRDVLVRVRPHLASGARVDDELDALLAEVEDALARRRW